MRIDDEATGERQASPVSSPNDPDPASSAGALERSATPPAAARWPLRLALAALLLGLFALEEAVFSSPPLSFTVGAPPRAGVLRDWESAPDDRPLGLVFSDGARVELDPGASARVVALGRAGAHLVLESGSAHLNTAQPRLRLPGEEPWRVSLGPFTLEAASARFDVAWDPRSDEVAIDVVDGSVAITGCEGEPADTLRAGEGVRASCAARQWARVPAGSPPTPP